MRPGTRPCCRRCGRSLRGRPRGLASRQPVGSVVVAGRFLSVAVGAACYTLLSPPLAGRSGRVRCSVLLGRGGALRFRALLAFLAWPGTWATSSKILSLGSPAWDIVVLPFRDQRLRAGAHLVLVLHRTSQGRIRRPEGRTTPVTSISTGRDTGIVNPRILYFSAGDPNLATCPQSFTHYAGSSTLFARKDFSPVLSFSRFNSLVDHLLLWGHHFAVGSSVCVHDCQSSASSG